ncbi:MAG: M4 family metallopeptidase, partial [Cytophagales bacterium]|nr:M4 family metallopeptidase [Cytophaga sp.]
ISFINVADPNDGSAMDNAFWNGKAMYYGNGNVMFTPLAGGLDVGGHELTHGVVQSTANLSYIKESGAINESMADIFGCMIDSLDWVIGEDVVLLSEFPSGALRSLSDPHNGGASLGDPGWQPKHVSEKYTGTGDNGGVHINSGITSYAFYLLAQSTKRTTAEKIFYRALSMYLTRSSQFIDLRLACIKSSDDLFGAGSTESVKTGLAFDQVGITVNSAPANPPQVNQVGVNPGTEFLLAVDVDPTHSYTLYRMTSPDITPSQLSKKALYTKPSVTDDGSVAYYVNNSNQIVGLFTTPGNTQETILDANKIWNSLAISKDGNRLAATTIYQDTSIYVFDFANNITQVFTLYNPTFSEGIKSGGPLYADALEWDHTGQYLIYDCYNEFSNTSGTNLSYWDVNFINVWDNTQNDFSDGTITKLFSSLPEGVSIGNPTLSKNSPNIIAFDYEDESTNEFYVIGCNTETNDVSIITDNNTLGFPSFNKLDNKIAFTYAYTSIRYKLFFTPLLSDKISPLGSVNTLITDYSKWPVYYANGVRDLPTSIKVLHGSSTSRPSASICPNPCMDKLTVSFISAGTGDGTIKMYHTSGQLLSENAISIENGNNEIPLSVASLHAGCYIIVVGTDNQSWTSRFVKQ